MRAVLLILGIIAAVIGAVVLIKVFRGNGNGNGNNSAPARGDTPLGKPDIAPSMQTKPLEIGAAGKDLGNANSAPTLRLSPTALLDINRSELPPNR